MRWHNSKESTWQCRRHKRCRFDPWVRKIPWRRTWQATPVFLLGESHGLTSLQATVDRLGKSWPWLKGLTCTRTFMLFLKFMPVANSISSVQLSHSVMSNSLRPHVLQHTRIPCPSPTPGLAQTHIHSVSDAIWPTHPLSYVSPPALNYFPKHHDFSNESIFCIR